MKLTKTLQELKKIQQRDKKKLQLNKVEIIQLKNEIMKNSIQWYKSRKKITRV